MSGEKTESSCSSDAELTDLEGAVGGLCQEKMDTAHRDSVAPGPSETPPAQQDSAPAKLEMTVDANYDRLVQERRNEIMFELRRLQLGDRPVTGQGNREAVGDFFSRALAPAGEQTVNPEANRPEAVSVEVNALVQRRPVSSMLGSVAFRRSLETALMGAIGNAQGRNTPSSTRAPLQTGPSNSHVGAHASARHARPIPQPRQTRRRAHPAASAIAEHLASRDQSTQPPTVGQPPAFIPPPPITEPLVGPALAQSWLEQQPDPQPEVVEELRNLTVWETLEQSQRDDLINDISELVQRQLVTSALEGDFRPVLEHQMQERLVTTGTDGQRVQQFVQALPHGGIRRNDFSELGIPETIDASLSDEVSVISATAAVTVNAQSNAATTREIRSLKGQMQELRNMMRLSFDLQLDIQRSIRQEVAAALSQALQCAPVGTASASQPPATATGAPVASRPVNDDSCLICLDGRAHSVLYQCGHMCVCHSCGLELRARGANCPVCRAPIRDIIRAYRSTHNQD